MAETVAQHQLAAITTPQNGDNLDATVVTGHFGSVRTDYNSHDADPGIHFQSSTFAARPAAGVAGRKWLTKTPDGRQQLWRDTGAAWEEVTGTTFALNNGQPNTIYNAGNSGTGITIDWSNGPVQKVTLTDNATLTFSNVFTGGTFTLVLIQDGTGGRTVSLTGWDFGDNAPTYNTGANKKNVVSGLYDGGEYLAAFGVKGA